PKCQGPCRFQDSLAKGSQMKTCSVTADLSILNGRREVPTSLSKTNGTTSALDITAINTKQQQVKRHGRF
ncbi:hypothetical protein TNCV_3044491, partial [Trichonephila clavipes]